MVSKRQMKKAFFIWWNLKNVGDHEKFKINCSIKRTYANILICPNGSVKIKSKESAIVIYSKVHTGAKIQAGG